MNPALVSRINNFSLFYGTLPCVSCQNLDPAWDSKLARVGLGLTAWPDVPSMTVCTEPTGPRIWLLWFVTWLQRHRWEFAFFLLPCPQSVYILGWFILVHIQFSVFPPLPSFTSPPQRSLFFKKQIAVQCEKRIRYGLYELGSNWEWIWILESVKCHGEDLELKSSVIAARDSDCKQVYIRKKEEGL